MVKFHFMLGFRLFWTILGNIVAKSASRNLNSLSNLDATILRPLNL